MNDPAPQNASGTVNAQDRRRDPRLVPEDAVSALGRVMDISASGMRIRCQDVPPINAGQPFKVEVRAEDRVTLLPVRLIDAYRLDPDEGEEGIDLGVEFRRLTPAQHREIETIIEHACEIPPLEVGWTTDPQGVEDDEEYEEHEPDGGSVETALRVLTEDATSQSAMIENAQDKQPRETKPGEVNQRRAGRLAADDADSSLGKVMDISATGLRVRRRGAAPVRVGSVFMIDLHAAGRTLRAPVEVVRIQKVGWRTFEYGLKFGELGDDVRAEFGRFARMASKCVEIH